MTVPCSSSLFTFPLSAPFSVHCCSVDPSQSQKLWHGTFGERNSSRPRSGGNSSDEWVTNPKFADENLVASDFLPFTWRIGPKRTNFSRDFHFARKGLFRGHLSDIRCQMSQKYVWFVTGTSSGLGNNLLHELLSSGHSIIATARKPEVLQAALDQKYDAETLKRALVVKLDVTQPEEVKAAFAAGIKKFGHIDIVVNNAGYAVVAEIEACPMEEARTQFEVMFWGPVYISKEAVRIFREVNPPGKGGQIFNVSSVGGYTSQPTLSYYNSAKFALEGFTESLRKEMSPEWNIQATIIEPGGFNTEWRGGNMSILPPHPAYDTDSSPTRYYRSSLRELPFIGNPERGAKAFVGLAGRRDLPLRIQFGSDSLALVRHTAMRAISDSEKWEDVSHSTNVDGIDPKEYTKNLLAALG